MSTGGKWKEIPDAMRGSNVTASRGSDCACLAASFPLMSCPCLIRSFVLDVGVCGLNCTAVPDARKLSSPTDWKETKHRGINLQCNTTNINLTVFLLVNVFFLMKNTKSPLQLIFRRPQVLDFPPSNLHSLLKSVGGGGGENGGPSIFFF